MQAFNTQPRVRPYYHIWASGYCAAGNGFECFVDNELMIGANTKKK